MPRFFDFKQMPEESPLELPSPGEKGVHLNNIRRRLMAPNGAPPYLLPGRRVVGMESYSNSPETPPLKRRLSFHGMGDFNRELSTAGGYSFNRTLSTESVAAKFQTHDLIFDLYREDNDKIFMPRFFKSLIEVGIRRDDPRLHSMINLVREAENLSDMEGLFESESLYLDRDTFKKCVGDSIGIISKALKGQLVIPDWCQFTKIMGELFEDSRPQDTDPAKGGKLASYIPQLARVDPNLWAMSICTVDGQRRSWGDSKVPFCLQSVSKPFTYALVHEEIGADELHKYVGQEPSGRLFNDICLDHAKKPHNPLINAGAIMCAAMMKRHDRLSDRFDFALKQFKRFCGDGFVGFNNAVFLSERDTADRNYALSYYMREHKCFPPNTNLQDTLDLYFQLCSIETNVDSLSVMAATLANGGVCPLNGERVINNRACRDTLSLMYSCGMYDYSGMFAFKVGLPAKSGVSGDMIIVIPNVMGICLYSPRLDALGNTVRGVNFTENFIQKFNFHNYDSLVYSDSQKLDPRKAVVEAEYDSISKIMFAAKIGDLQALKRYMLLGYNLQERDYDDRTVLHIAACEGNDQVLEFILKKWRESPEPRDRFGKSPLDNAMQFNNDKCAAILKAAAESFLKPINE